MCLIFLSFNNHPDYALIVAANRDEFYNRKTAAAHYWAEEPSVLAGKDLEAGGSWMGIRTNGKLSMITNFRDPKNINPAAPSRGHLVSDYLLNGQKPLPYLEHVSLRGREYNGFNLILGTPEELYYYSNYKGVIEPLPPGLHGISNHLLNTPWPKVEKGLGLIRKLISGNEIDVDALLSAMADEDRAPDHTLPDTGVGLDRERALSSMFIKSPGYGSRSTTVLLIGRDGSVRFAERTYDTETFDYATRSFELALEK
jgi:uncharacterized protein with NRDE domain